MSIPRNFHFIFGLRPQDEPFHLTWYLSLRSCIDVNEPETVYFHYLEEPWGPLWDLIKPELTMKPVEPDEQFDLADRYEQHSEGRYILKHGLQYAHHADFLRLAILSEMGGVYADIDTLFVRPYPREFFEHDFLIGREKPVRTPDGGISSSLCNAVLFARPGARFSAIWLEEMYAHFDGRWNAHSCRLAADLARKHPSDVHVVPRDHFYYFIWSPEDLEALFEQDAPVPDELCSIHLWSHLWWKRDWNSFTEFSGEDISIDNIRSRDTTFNRLARPFLPTGR